MSSKAKDTKELATIYVQNGEKLNTKLGTEI